MTGSTTRRASWLLAACAALAPARAGADGGLIIREGETEVVDQVEAAARGLVSSSGQRALLRLSADGCWDLTVDPGTVELGAAAWVMPLPVEPEVEEASPELLEQLDAATLPVLVTHSRTVITHYETSSSGGGSLGCGGLAAADGRGEEVGGTDVEDGGSEGEAPPVRILGEGRIGGLEYDVVSAEEPGALFAWLSENGYAVPPAMEEPVTRYVEEGFVFFAARLARDAGDGTAVPAVRFGLCGGVRPFYPVRLTALSVAESFAFTLWIAVPADHSFLTPSDCEHAPLSSALGSLVYDPGDSRGMEEPTEWPPPDFQVHYEETVAEITARNRGRSLALELATVLDAAAVERRVEVLGEQAEDLGLATTDSWAPELRDIVASGLRVMRYTGRMPAVAMEHDLHFQVDLVAEESGVHVREVTYREERWDWEEEEEEEEDPEPAFGSPECAAPGTRAGAPPLLLAALLGLALAALRGRGRRG